MNIPSAAAPRLCSIFWDAERTYTRTGGRQELALSMIGEEIGAQIVGTGIISAVRLKFSEGALFAVVATAEAGIFTVAVTATFQAALDVSADRFRERGSATSANLFGRERERRALEES